VSDYVSDKDMYIKGMINFPWWEVVLVHLSRKDEASVNVVNVLWLKPVHVVSIM